jgi:dihydroorotase
LYFNEQQILANNPEYLEKLFSRAETLVALHSEDESIIDHNYEHYFEETKGQIPFSLHAKIRSTEACVTATKRVLGIQAKYNNRLHFFHISTGEEALLFPASVDYRAKRVTAEACVHHLWFSEADYEKRGGAIKWNPSIKTEQDRQTLIQALKDGRIDIIASDHAPHSKQEKQGTYEQVKSGAPIVQHNLPLLFELSSRGEISIEQIVEKTSHRVADIYRLKNRGYLREGYFADLVEMDVNAPWEVTEKSLLYKCGWAPVVGEQLSAKVKRTFVNGNLVFQEDKFISEAKGSRLFFEKIR